MGTTNISAEKQQKTRALIMMFTIALLGILAIATAWGGYHSVKWGGNSSRNFLRANAERTASMQASLTANQLKMLDIQVFIEWLNASAQDDARLATFYRERMREEAVPAFEAWLGQDPLNNPDAAKTPFTLPEYVLQKDLEAEQRQESAAAFFQAGTQANKTASEYVLTTVFLALAMFFAGLSPRVLSIKVSLILTSIALLTFGYGVTRLIVLWMEHGA